MRSIVEKASQLARVVVPVLAWSLAQGCGGKNDTQTMERERPQGCSVAGSSCMLRECCPGLAYQEETECSITNGTRTCQPIACECVASGSGSDAGAGGAPPSGAGGSPPGAGGSAPAAGGSPLPGTGGASGAGGRGPAGPPNIGESCTQDADCGAGLECFTEGDSRLGGGVAGGVCTTSCMDYAYACSDLDPEAFCVQFTATEAVCMQSCFAGPSGAEKCAGRENMACYEGLPGLSYCSPTCRGDFECAGRTCDLSLGLCVDALVGTIPFGEPCDLSADTCRGSFCLPQLEGGAFCSGVCTIGSIGCGEDPRSLAPLTALCLLVADPSHDLGDLGYCAKLCDCDDDCPVPGNVCDPFPLDYPPLVGRVGSCSGALGLAGTPCGGVPAAR